MPRTALKLLAMAGLAAIIAACAQNTATTNTVITKVEPPTNMEISTTPASQGGARMLSTDAVKPFFVDSYFSPYAHGPAQMFYTFPDGPAVLQIRIPNDDDTFEIQGGFHLFDDGVTTEELGYWVNNQHSDALYGNAPHPVETVPAADFMTITNAMPAGTKTGHDRRAYEAFKVTFRVKETTARDVTLPGFDAGMVVHVRRGE